MISSGHYILYAILRRKHIGTYLPGQWDEGGWGGQIEYRSPSCAKSRESVTYRICRRIYI